MNKPASERVLETKVLGLRRLENPKKIKSSCVGLEQSLENFKTFCYLLFFKKYFDSS